METATVSLRVRIRGNTTKEALDALVRAMEACTAVDHYEIAKIVKDS